MNRSMVAEPTSSEVLISGTIAFRPVFRPPLGQIGLIQIWIAFDAFWGSTGAQLGHAQWWPKHKQML